MWKDQPKDRNFNDLLCPQKIPSALKYAALGNINHDRWMIPFMLGFCRDPNPF